MVVRDRLTTLPGRLPPEPSTVLGLLGAGALVTASIDSTLTVFAGGPTALAVALGVAVAGVALAPERRGATAWAAAALGAGGAAFDLALLRGLAPLAGEGALVPLAVALAIGWTAIAAAPLRGALARARPVHLLAGALPVAALALPDPRGALVALYLLGVAGSLAVDPRLVRLGARPRALPVGRGLVAAAVALAALVGWSSVRAPLDPSAGATVGGLLAAVAALAALDGAAAGLVAVAGTVALVAGAALGVDAEPALGARAGAAWAAALGATAGAWWAWLRPREAAGPALVLAAGLLGPAMAALDPARILPAVRSRVTLGDDPAARARVDALRDGAALRAAAVGPAGAAAVWALPRGWFAELDGSVAHPDTRAGNAERLAGTLAACATDGRALARVAGDDLGLALQALATQGFRRVDVVVAEPTSSRAVAALVPALGDAWVHPGVRLLAQPGPGPLRVGGPADAVVEVVRSGLTDARGRLPDRRGLAATRRTLAPGGVHVVALGAAATDAARMRAVLHAFAAAYPHGRVWLPADGVETALLVGTAEDRPLAWAGFERCVTADRAALARLAVRAPLDLAGLGWATAADIAALGPGEAGLGLPATRGVTTALPLLDLPGAGWDVAAVFDAAAPRDALAERHAALGELLAVVRSAAAGQLTESVDRARALARTPAGARAVEPLIRPHLQRAREALDRAAREGAGSRGLGEAEAAIGTARLIWPASPDVLCLEAELAERRGSLEVALEAWGRCRAADPARLAALDGLARVNRVRGDLLAAERLLREAVELHPEVWSTHHNLGVLLFSVGRTEEAERRLREAVVVQGRAADGPPDAAPDRALARLYLGTGRPALALAAAERAVQLQPGAEAHFLRGASRFELRQEDLAETDFLEALRLDPDHLLARGGLGQVQAVRGEYALAAESFRAVLRVDPQNQQAAANLERLRPYLR